MATIQQIDANRRNASKSTGPKTPEGKAAVSMNALRHGLRARSVVLPGEDRDEFHQLCDDLEVEWQPQSRTERFYLEQMATSQWKLTRMEVGESIVRERFTYIDEQLPHLDRLWQAQCRMERSYARAQRALERIQNSRRNQIHPQPEVQVPTPQPVANAGPAAASPDSEPEPASKETFIPVVAPAAAPSAAAFPQVGQRNGTTGRNVTFQTTPASNILEQDCA
jgi:hypothetical protein